MYFYDTLVDDKILQLRALVPQFPQFYSICFINTYFIKHRIAHLIKLTSYKFIVFILHYLVNDFRSVTLNIVNYKAKASR